MSDEGCEKGRRDGSELTQQDIEKDHSQQGRVIPGHLAVSRTFGDVEAKLCCFGGAPGVISATPEIQRARIREDTDFIVLGCDGVFDVLSNEDVVGRVWDTAHNVFGAGKSFHETCGECVTAILRMSMEHRSFDNVTAVLIAFPHFKKTLKEKLDWNAEKSKERLGTPAADLKVRSSENLVKESEHCLDLKYVTQRTGDGGVIKRRATIGRFVIGCDLCDV